MFTNTKDFDNRMPVSQNKDNRNGIYVIADDFTGAAEIAGIALRFGLKLNIYLDNSIFDVDAKTLELRFSSSDGAIFCTDSRSLPTAEALKITADTLTKLLQLHPAFIYKKIDSVLRGYVIKELQVQMEITGQKKVLIVPANPSIERTISNGEYMIGGKKITETDFINDPDFPVTSSLVEKMLKDNTIIVQSPVKQLPLDGIIVGETSSTADVERWASKMDKSWMQAGGGDFFAALLKNNYRHKYQDSTPSIQKPFLYVCGTAGTERKMFIRSLHARNNCVLYLHETENENWVEKAIAMLANSGKLIIAIDDRSNTAINLKSKLAKIAKQLIEQLSVREIFIEGGSTAAAIFAELKVTVLQPDWEIANGVVRMTSGNLCFTTKPGSYDLPDEINRLLN